MGSPYRGPPAALNGRRPLPNGYSEHAKRQERLFSCRRQPTGVGGPVVDMLRQARLGIEVCAVTITGGGKELAATDGFHVRKQDLFSGGQGLLEKGELAIPRQVKAARARRRELWK